jgi:hypothetical protein
VTDHSIAGRKSKPAISPAGWKHNFSYSIWIEKHLLVNCQPPTMCFGRQLTKDTLSWVLCGLDWYAVSARVTLSTFESYCLYSIFLQWLEIKYTCEEACTSEYLCDVWFMKLSICLNEAKKIHSNDNLGMLIKYSDCCVPFLIWRWSHSNQSSLKSLKWKMENHHSWSIAWLNVLCSHCQKTWDRCFIWSGPICST